MSDERVSRRGFARTCAFVWPALLTGAIADDQATPESERPIRDRESREEDPVPAAEDFLLAALTRLYPGYDFTAERLAGMRMLLRHRVVQGEMLRNQQLQNHEGPATTFRALVPRPRSPETR